VEISCAWIAGAVAIAVAVVIAITGSMIGSMINSIAVAGALAGVIILTVAFAVAVVGRQAREAGWQGIFLSGLLIALVVICLGSAKSLASLSAWEQVGPMLLFLGLLTLLNAPFDWVSLGLTRALLRRGLELGGWWPYVLALVDAGLAVLIITALALTMVIGVQVFDALAVHGGGKAILGLDALFDGVAAHPTAPEYWWLYALLLSTMIPRHNGFIALSQADLNGYPAALIKP